MILPMCVELTNEVSKSGLRTSVRTRSVLNLDALSKIKWTPGAIVSLDIRGESLLHPGIDVALKFFQSKQVHTIVNTFLPGSVLLKRLETLELVSRLILNIGPGQTDEEGYVIKANPRLKGVSIWRRYWTAEGASRGLLHPTNSIEYPFTPLQWFGMAGDDIIQVPQPCTFRKSLTILSDGTVVPCPYMEDANVVYGSIFSKSWVPVEEEHAKFQPEFPTELCQNCTKEDWMYSLAKLSPIPPSVYVTKREVKPL